ncbi:response regulator [Candidatus Saccharibacteria bacterium]|nr:response regulator [Candidatus Saccharibacteria bacterium]
MDEPIQTPALQPLNQPQPPAGLPVSESVPSQPPVTPGPPMPPLPPTEPAPTTPPQPLSVASPTPPAATKPKKILLVEDDQSLASVYLTRLQAEGFDVKHVPNGEDALAAALTYKPDLVLLDIMMPKISGFDVLDIFRNTPETTNLKVVMLTALSQDADKQRALSLGVDDYLVKSQVVIADVVERIKHHLSVSK